MNKALLVLLALAIFAGSAFALDIVMDAQRDDFYNTLTGPEDGFIYLGPEAWAPNWTAPDDAEDMSAHVWFAWDTTFFYTYIEVTDEWITVNNATTYLNDALELKIDPDPYMCDETTTGVAAFRLHALSEDDAEVPEAVENVDSGEAGEWSWETVDGEDYARAEISTDTRYGYNLEQRIPFEVIVSGDRVVDNSIGGIIGLAVNAMDNDSGDRDHVLQWSSDLDDMVWNEPYRHGTVTFLEGNKISMSTENTITGLDTNTIDYQPTVGVETDPIAAPVEFNLSQNYPNPFNPVTKIDFSLPTSSMVTMTVYDILGNEVSTLVNEAKSAGLHTVTFNGSDLNSGIYFYKLQYGAEILTNKMMLVK